MALIETPGAANADTYATMAEADAAQSLRNRTSWAAGTVAEREAAMRAAAIWLDIEYAPRFNGAKTAPRVQSLEWPRTEATDISGYIFEADEIPTELINAQIEAAWVEFASPGSMYPNPGTDSSTRISSLDVDGAVALTYEAVESGGGSAAGSPLDVVGGILRPILASSPLWGGASTEIIR